MLQAGISPVRLCIIWLVSFLAFVCLTPHIAKKLNPVTGDEPFYLMTALSVIRDSDLDESNNYRESQYLEFAPSCAEMEQPGFAEASWNRDKNSDGVLAPGLKPNCKAWFPKQVLVPLKPHASRGVRDGKLYSKHGLGLSLLIAPFYALGGRILVMLFMAALSALLGVNIWLLAYEVSASQKNAWISWATFQFCSPIICFSFLIFPAIPAALCLLYAFRTICCNFSALNSSSRQIFLAGCALGFLPWLHAVYALLCLSLVLSLGLHLAKATFHIKDLAAWEASSKLCALLLPCIVSAAALMLFYLQRYGSPWPNWADHNGLAPFSRVPLQILGLLFDQKYGLLIFTPALLFSFAGFLMAAGTGAESRSLQRALGAALVCVLPYFLFIANYNYWWGEWGPPARYLVPVVPLLVPAFTIALRTLSAKFSAALFAIFSLWGFAIAALFMYNPHTMYNWQTTDPATWLVWLKANFSPEAWFPAVITQNTFRGQAIDWVPLAVFGLLAAGLIGWIWQQGRKL